MKQNVSIKETNKKHLVFQIVRYINRLKSLYFMEMMYRRPILYMLYTLRK